MEHFLIVVVDQLVLKHSFTFMSPETDQEQFLSDLVFQLRGILDNVELMLLSDCANTLEDSGQLSDVEDVVELCWCGKESSLHLFPKSDSGINQ